MRASIAIAFTFALAVHAAGAAELSSNELAAGRKLAAAKCVACHKMHDPTAYDAERWNEWMSKMKRKAKLNDEQFTKLSRYFEAQRHEIEQPQPKSSP